MVKSGKKYDTGLRVLEILKILLQEDCTKVELIEKLKQNSKVGTVYTLEAFIKYFNTFEAAGFKLNKNRTKYGVSNSLLEINLTKREKEILCSFIAEAKKIYSKKERELFAKFILKLNKHLAQPLDKDDLSVLYAEPEHIYSDNIRNNIVMTLNNYLNEGLQVQIKYQRTKKIVEELVVEIKEIIEKKNNFFVVCYCPSLGINKKICIDSIISLTQLHSINRGNTYLNPVVFTLYGRLAGSYKLKQYEKVINFSKYHLTVSNNMEDKDVLLHRLLKYGSNCEIVKPKSMIDEFMNTTDEMLKNLQED